MHGLGAQAPLEVEELAVRVSILNPAALQEQGAHIRVRPRQHKHLQVGQVRRYGRGAAGGAGKISCQDGGDQQLSPWSQEQCLAFAAT